MLRKNVNRNFILLLNRVVKFFPEQDDKIRKGLKMYLASRIRSAEMPPVSSRGLKKMNPFKYGQTVSSSDYCPRTVLEKELKSRIISSQNTYIEGEGRTSAGAKANIRNGKKGCEACLARLTFIQMKCLRALAKRGGKNTLAITKK